MPGLAAIVVSWNVRDLLRDCLASLRLPPTPDEIVVVDNASADGTPDMLAVDFPSVTVIKAGANLGFAAGVNVGIAASSGAYLLVLNPDTEMRPGSLDALKTLMDRDPSLAVAAPALVGTDGERQSSRRRFPNWIALAVESTALQKLPLLARVVSRYHCADTPDSHVQEIDWAYGACFLVRRSALEEAGGMDSTYFMYSEEVDLCRRLKQLGWSIAYEPAATVVHREARSSSQVPVSRMVRFNRAKVLYAAKHIGRLAGEALRLHLLATLVWEAGVEAAKLGLGHKPELRRERIRAYRTVLGTGLRQLL